MAKQSQPQAFRDALLHLCYLLAVLSAGVSARAQYRYDVWTADSGLPQNIVRSIYQSPDGFLWIATFDGLVRFDGVHFVVFNKSNTAGIESNRFGAMYGDPSGDLWLNTEGGGLTRYHKGVFSTLGVEQGLPAKTVRAVTGDDAGHLWILNSDTIEEWNEAKGRFVDVTPEEHRTRYEPLRWDNAGFWGWDEHGIHCFIKGRFVTYPMPQGISGKSVWVAASDARGAVWIETFDHKYFSIDSDGSASSPTTSASTTFVDGNRHSWTIRLGDELYRSVDYLNSGQTATIQFGFLYEDRERNLWFGTEGQGLYRLQRQSISVCSKQQGLLDDNIYPILQDRTGAMWIGAWPKGVSRLYDGRFTNFTVNEGVPSRLVTAIYEDHDGQIWIAAHGGLAIYRNGQFRSVAEPSLPERTVVQAIYQDREGTMWFGSTRGLLSLKGHETHLYTTKDGLAVDDARVILETRQGDLWIGGYGGLTRIRNGQFAHWTEHEGLPSNNVRSLYEDKDGTLWIGTYDGGLGRLKDGKLVPITMRDGLFNNGAFQILEDDRGNFWMSCNRGIYRVSKQALNDFADGKQSSVASVAYGKVDGMTNVECNGGLWPAGTRARDGKLWFPTQQGVAVIDPAAVSYNPQPPPVVIDSFLVDRAPVKLTGPLRLPPRAENLEIHYTAPSFIKPEQIHFKYKLEGLDSNWIDAGARRIAYYSHLPPGKYVFHVIAGNSDGVWNNEGKTLAVTVLAPFYQTWWFELLALLTIGALVAAAWKYRVSQLEQAQAVQQAFAQKLIASQEAERKRIAADMHDSLGQRLIVIKNLALFLLRSKKNGAADNADAQTIAEISDEASSAIEETREISYNLRPFQLDRLGLTKAIEGMIRTTATASGIHFTSELDNIDDLFPEDLRINFYRIVQESLGNVMKHAQATEVRVLAKRSPQNLTLTIEDDGRGFAPDGRTHPSSRSGFGLTGMAERAHLLGGEFKVRSTQGRGTTVTVEIPLNGSHRG
jgi:signal transduction histidine kinase/ligand-binding sensor domain-containing protein